MNNNINYQSPLFTDLYQLTMGYGYWKQGMAEQEAVFHLFFRKAPFGEECAVVAGVSDALEWVRRLRFDASELEYLGGLLGADGLPLFSQDYLLYLAELEFDLDIWGIEEGELAYPHEPILRVRGPMLQCQLVETGLLNMINFQTLVATQSARLCEAAQGDQVLEFGLRRAQGPDGGISASRAAFLGGCSATSNVLAGMKYGIPVKGTHAHSWVMSFPSEDEAFRAYAEAMPNNVVLLVDTYDTVEGVKKAIEVGKILEAKGKKLLGVRLDSGDLAALSIEARRLFDEAGLTDAKVVASNDLSVETIRELKAQGAKIDIWGVGTKLVTCYEQAALGGVYKLAAIRNCDEWQWKVKLSNDLIKVSNPGILQVRRDSERDIIFHDESGKQAGLLKPASELRHGKLLEARERAIRSWEARSPEHKVELDPKVEQMKQALFETYRGAKKMPK